MIDLGEAVNKREKKILDFWEEHKIFEKSLKQREKAKPFVFFEGPPTANGLPHIGHFLTRVYKDLYGRYKTMRGYFVLRRAGWDTHGLPVEIEVEKELGFKNKKDIEEYGIAKFNQKAKESVWKYKNEWEKMTKRMGFWLDLENPYVTYDSKYIESVWWIIKQIWDKKLLYRGHKVIPFCTRCGTGLSSHEVAQGYREITEPSVYVKFKIKAGQRIGDWPLPENTYFLAWTTTPWTLPGNVALAVGEKIDYAVVQDYGQVLILAKDLAKVVSEKTEIAKEVKGKELVGLEYQPLFEVDKLRSPNSYKVYPADFVSTEEGTGIVHTAVMYGEDDYELGKKYGLPTWHTVSEQGIFTDDVPEFTGQYVKDAERGIIEYLKNNNLLFKESPHTHTYPFCWRCDTPLLYYANDSWFIRMSDLRKQLVKNNEKINWFPEHIKEGRFGEFLKEAKDWALSRQRYWGTPLPVWQCRDCGKHLVAGALEDLEKYRFRPKNKFYILRHGQSEKDTAIDGKIPAIASRLEQDKYNLTELGRKQVQRAAEIIEKMGSVDLIFHSPFIRTTQTAKIVSEATGITGVSEERLKELDHGSLCEGREHGVCTKPDEKVKFATQFGDGESWQMVRRRMFSLIKELDEKYENKKILLVGHAASLWVLQSITENHDSERVPQETYNHHGYLSFAEIRELDFKNYPYDTDGLVDLHRPYIDEVILKCPDCGQAARWVADLIDAWFDSGSMPYAQWHYPFENKKLIDDGQQYPADFIVEAIDQTRGWFYTLLAIAAALDRKPPYKNVMVLGHILDDEGKKMSKSRGNAVTPDEVMNKVGADAARWYFYSASTIGEAKSFLLKDAQSKLLGFVSTLSNLVRFLNLYSGETLKNSDVNFENLELKTSLDVWLSARFNLLVSDVTLDLDTFDPTGASRKIEDFIIKDLSNWWLRRSRKRFQKPKTRAELASVSDLFRNILIETSKLLAPFMPFLAEEIFIDLNGQAVSHHQSVHLCDWPSFAKAMKGRSQELLQSMTRVRDFVTLGLAQRKTKNIKVRQPLASITFKSDKFEPELEELIKDELNVKHVNYDETLIQDLELNEQLTRELVIEGYARETVRQIQDLRKDVGYRLDEKVSGFWDSEDKEVKDMMSLFGDEIASDTSTVFQGSHDTSKVYDAEKEFELAPGVKIRFGIKK